MFLSSLSKSVLLVISMASVAQAYLIPGGQSGPNNPPGQYQPGIGGEQDGWVDPGSGVDPNPYQPPGRPVRPGRPGHGNPGFSNDETRTILVRRQMVNERLNLRSMSGVGSRYSGWELMNVRVNINPNMGSRANIQLVADGRIVAAEMSQGYQVNLAPQMRLVLDSNVRTLQLLVNGAVYVNEIQLELVDSQGSSPQLPPHEPPPYPGNPGYPPSQPGYGQQRVDINVYRNLNGNDRLDLSQYINLSRYQGLAIEQVIVQGTGSYNSAFLNLIINGNNLGQAVFTGRYSQQQSIWLNQRRVIGQGAESIVLYSSGQMTVERVTLVLSY